MELLPHYIVYINYDKILLQTCYIHLNAFNVSVNIKNKCSKTDYVLITYLVCLLC